MTRTSDQTGDEMYEGAAPSAAVRAYQKLEQMIVTLELPPASITTEGALIERIGLGRTPVREAIQRLAWEGLLEIRPRAGIAVAPLHPSDWVKVIDARRGVEQVLARAATRNATQHSARRFHDAAQLMRKAVIADNVVAFLDADKALDEAMAEAADNPYAARLAAPLQTHSRRFWFRYQAETGLEAAAARHMALIKSILDGDIASADVQASRLMELLRGHALEAAGL